MFKFFALQNGDYCACDNSYATPRTQYNKTADTDCQHDKADHTLNGAGWRNAVYQANPDARTLAPTPPTPYPTTAAPTNPTPAPTPTPVPTPTPTAAPTRPLGLLTDEQEKTYRELEARDNAGELTPLQEREFRELQGKMLEASIPLPEKVEPDELVNVALDLHAEQSSTVLGANAARAVDDNTAQEFEQQSCTMTSGKEKPWWRVDLGKDPVPVWSVALWNPHNVREEDLEKMTALEVHISNSRNEVGQKCSGAVQEYKGTMNIVCENLKGRYVTVSLAQQAVLSLCEAQVYVDAKTVKLQHDKPALLGTDQAAALSGMMKTVEQRLKAKKVAADAVKEAKMLDMKAHALANDLNTNQQKAFDAMENDGPSKSKPDPPTVHSTHKDGLTTAQQEAFEKMEQRDLTTRSKPKQQTSQAFDHAQRRIEAISPSLPGIGKKVHGTGDSQPVQTAVHVTHKDGVLTATQHEALKEMEETDKAEKTRNFHFSGTGDSQPVQTAVHATHKDGVLTATQHEALKEMEETDKAEKTRNFHFSAAQTSTWNAFEAMDNTPMPGLGTKAGKKAVEEVQPTGNSKPDQPTAHAVHSAHAEHSAHTEHGGLTAAQQEAFEEMDSMANAGDFHLSSAQVSTWKSLQAMDKPVEEKAADADGDIEAAVAEMLQLPEDEAEGEESMLVERLPAEADDIVPEDGAHSAMIARMSSAEGVLQESASALAGVKSRLDTF